MRLRLAVSPARTITPDDVAVFVDHARAVGVDQVTLADTTGVGTPRRVGAVLDRVGTDVGLHLHDTRGTALLNAWTAIDRGVTRFDTAVGGLGGSPFAPAAGGNLATEKHSCTSCTPRATPPASASQSSSTHSNSCVLSFEIGAYRPIPNDRTTS